MPHLYATHEGPPDAEGETVLTDVCIHYSFTPGAPAVRYQRNGEPGWPADPAEVELDRAEICLDGRWITAPPEITTWAEAYLAGEGNDRAIETGEDERGVDPDMARDLRREDKEDWGG